jgi:hypothetical protein
MYLSSCLSNYLPLSACCLPGQPAVCLVSLLPAACLVSLLPACLSKNISEGLRSQRWILFLP